MQLLMSHPELSKKQPYLVRAYATGLPPPMLLKSANLQIRSFHVSNSRFCTKSLRSWMLLSATARQPLPTCGQRITHFQI